MSEASPRESGLLKKWSARIGIVAAALALVAAIVKMDDWYVTPKELDGGLDKVVVTLKTDLDELSREIIRNRKVMQKTMQMDADDLDYEIEKMVKSGEEVPRYMRDKQRQFKRDIQELTQ